MPEEIPSSPPQPSRPLVYERLAGITPGAFRLLLLLTFLNTILHGVNLMGPQSWQAMRSAYNEWKDRRAQATASALRVSALRAARAFQFPERHVAYTEVPDEAMKLLFKGLYRPISLKPQSASSPPGWQTPVAADPLVAPAPGRPAFHQPGLLFLHKRKTPNGTAALVQVGITADYKFDRTTTQLNGKDFEATFSLSKQRRLWATAFVSDENDPKPIARNRFTVNLVLPDTDTTEVARATYPMDQPMPTSQPLVIAPGHQLRLYGGSPDPADSSHFTIPYELDGKPGIIDGWLLEDSVQLRPRQGQAIASAGNPTWDLLPATRPADAR